MTSSVEIEVCASWQGLEAPRTVGLLCATTVRGRNVFSFAYDKDWLRAEYVLQLDPRLSLFEGPQYPPADLDSFGVFLDSSPDRWGRVLLNRREAARARQESRKPRALREVDYLLGVFDPHRQGGLRYRLGTDQPFLDDDTEYASPPWTSLRALEEISRRLEESGVENDPSYSRWLGMLVAPGRSLGGARPKASVVDDKGNLWIAKFPSASDTEDIGAWEGVVHTLAMRAGIVTAPARVERFGSPNHTFITQRFDREKSGGRVHFVSAMTQLEMKAGEAGASYLDLAEILIQQGAQPTEDLEQLWRRVAFNVCVSNVDDHLRNHGFLLGPSGWRLAPAYDMNPVAHGDGLTLNISDSDNSQHMDLVLEVADYFRVKKARAQQILRTVREAVAQWREVAAGLGISRDAQDRMENAFRLTEELSRGGR
ncbi:MAG: HipA domain-containing protein [Deltaproteobacteria bacterium]|nr:HipA domain-containing protein [Deltaproteobacteria bacterium]